MISKNYHEFPVQSTQSIIAELVHESGMLGIDENWTGFRYRILFNQQGYTPHCAEHYTEPDGEKLLLADPHTRRSVFVYNIDKGIIEWEHRVPGKAIRSNPHIARFVNFDVPELGLSKRDLMFADMDNKWNVIDFDGRIKYQVGLQDTKWTHDFLLSKNRDGFIVTDYLGGFVRKINFKGKVIWRVDDLPHVAKLSVVEGETTSGVHTNSYGGDYLAVQNSFPYGIYEIRDEDGRIVRRIPNGPGTVNNFWCSAPHSAYRKGVAENGGNLTVVGFEAGGGLLALDQNQRPRWGVMKGFTNLGGHQYIPSRHGLMETTHVFPTVSGGVGAIDWSGKMSSRVIEISEFPKSTLCFHLAWDFDPGELAFLDPPLDVLEFDEVALDVINLGSSPIKYSVWGTNVPCAFADDWNSGYWRLEESGTIGNENSYGVYFDNFKKKRTFLRVSLARYDKSKAAKTSLIASYS